MTAIILYLLSQICNSIAAVCSALMDKTETEIQFNDSIWWNKNPAYWSKVFSAKVNNFLKRTKYRWDAWHNAKSGMIIAYMVHGILLALAFLFMPIEYLTLPYMVSFISAHIALFALNNIKTFDLFYNKIFKKRGN